MRRPLAAAKLAFLLLSGTAHCEYTTSGHAPQTGAFSQSNSIREVASEEFAAAAESFISPHESINWEFYVPENYDPQKPAGLMVYVSPSPSGDIPRGWKAIVDGLNMIWVAATGSGNRVAVGRRVVFALAAPSLAGRHYQIDPQRIYLSGLSGGGKSPIWWRQNMHSCSREQSIIAG